MVIDKFDGEYRFLSNFYVSGVVYDGVSYPSSENAYQAAKTLDTFERDQFVNCTAGQAKRLGQKITLREDWEDVKIQIMLSIVRSKFKRPYLRDRLLATGDAILIEGNTWGDTFWGVCDGKGENWLGKILMVIRSELLHHP